MRLAAAALLAPLCAAAAAQGDAGRPDPAPVFAWLAAHGYPDPGGRQFGALLVGEDVEHGFLLHADAERLVVFTTDGIEREVRRAAGVSWQVAPFEDHVRQTLRQWTVDPRRFGLRRSREPRPNHGTVFLLVAWGAERHGLSPQAAELAAAAAAIYGSPTTPLAKLFVDDLAAVALWQLSLDFARPEVGWQVLAERCDAIAERFADSRFAVALTRMAAALRREAQASWQPTGDGPADELGELVFRLREQNGTQPEGGDFDVFADPRGAASPAARLAAAGEAAVPHLLPALDADGYTRCVAFHDPTIFTHRVLTIGAVAREVFARITGYLPRSRADGERWWQDRAERGEVTVLLEGAARGDARQARRLVTVDPEAALVALTEGLVATPPNRNPPLLEVLSGIPDEQATALLREHLLRSPAGAARLTAAVALCLRGEVDAAVAGVAAAWRAEDPKIAVPALARFLATSGRRAALAALLAQPGRLDDAVFDLLAGQGTFRATALAPGGAGEAATWTGAEPEPGYEQELERALGDLVDVGRGTPGLRAARAMARRWSDVYEFDASAPVRDQAAMLERLRAAWRARRGGGR